MGLGAWIFAAPWALGFAFGPFPAAALDHWAVGAALFFISASSLSNARTPAESALGQSMQHEPARH
ncbi:MAG: SPW repeat protein [Pseudolabrys sp.]